MKPSDSTPNDGKAGTLLSHLVELRSRLLKSVAAVLVLFLGFAPFANDLYTVVAAPLMQHLGDDSSMIATQVASPFLTPFKLSLVLAIFASMPVVLYQLWAFVAPGLYSQERRFAIPLLLTSILLFYAGIAFAYFIVFPLMFGFFTAVAPTGVTVMTYIAHYLDFVLMLFFAFGLAFEVPIATVLLVWTGITTPAKMSGKRPFVFLGAFIAGMMLTPPDVVSQLLLAFPIYLLFEAGIILARVIVPGHREVEAQQAGADAEK